MPRAQSTDMYHVFKFKVMETSSLRMIPVAGFTTVTVPEFSLENVEYKEGIWTYRRKYPGDVTVSDVTMTKGVVKQSSFMYDWVKATIDGKAYRIDFDIYQFHRDDISGDETYENVQASRIIHCFEVIPLRVKPGSDFDAMASEVSLEEIDVSIERFTIEYKVTNKRYA